MLHGPKYNVLNNANHFAQHIGLTQTLYYIMEKTCCQIGHIYTNVSDHKKPKRNIKFHHIHYLKTIWVRNEESLKYLLKRYHNRRTSVIRRNVKISQVLVYFLTKAFRNAVKLLYKTGNRVNQDCQVHIHSIILQRWQIGQTCKEPILIRCCTQEFGNRIDCFGHIWFFQFGIKY